MNTLSASPQADAVQRDRGGVEQLVLQRIERMERAMRRHEPKWQEALSFLDNDQYVEVSAIDGKLDRLETREGTTKPRHRVRLTRNRYTPAIMREASLMTGRVPVYEVDAINADSSDGARFGRKALQWAHQEYGVPLVAYDVAQYALTTGAGFTWWFWNSDVGDFLSDPRDPQKTLREGDIGVHVLGQQEVAWQPGTMFYDSRYYMVRKAQPVEEVNRRARLEGYGEVKPDAMSAPHEARRGDESADLVFVYHYLERPSIEHPFGRWLQIANNRPIAKSRDYPCKYDVPVLQWVPWLRRRHQDRPMGMGELMLDIQRTYNRTISQIVAFKNLVLNPQVMAPVGSLRQQLDDTPGAVWHFRPIAGMVPQWRDMPDLPVGLFRVLEQCIADWQEVTGTWQLPDGVDGGAGVAARNEREMGFRAQFVKSMADWYARSGMAILRLMQEHMTEDRLLVIPGRFGTETVAGFRGTRLYGIAQVRVSEGSIEPRTRAAQQALIISLIDKGLVDPKKAIMALNAGTADALIDDYELDVAKQKREIQQLIDMGSMKGQGVPMVDETADNHAVHLELITSWMKTPDYEAQPDMVKVATATHAQWHEQVMQAKAMQQAMLTSMTAQSLGAQNAGKPQGPQGPKPMPSQPSMESALRTAQGAPTRS